MRWRMLLVLFALVLSLVPGAALAQDGSSEDSFLLGVNGQTYIGPEQSVDVLVVISDDSVIDGTIAESLVVIDGTATVNGVVAGDVTVISGTLNLQDGARVAKDVTLINSDINQAAGATVAGKIEKESFAFYGWQFTVLSILFWIGATIVILLAGLLFAAIGGRQLTGAAHLITDQPGKTVLTALIVGLGLPVLAVMAIVTFIGLPVGFAVLLFLLPVLWFLGYLVAGTKLGLLMLQRGGRDQHTVEHPYLAAFLGLLVLQVVGLVPFFGGTIAVLAGFVGLGAVAYYAYRGWRGTGTVEGPSGVTTSQPIPAA